MKIASFNVNSVRARLDILVAWLRSRHPDIVCLQETKADDDHFPEDVLRDAGYAATFRGEKSYNGVAILSRREPDKVSFGFDDGGPADGTRLMTAKFGPVHVVNTYVPQGRDITHDMYTYKLVWLKRLRRFFGRHYSTRMKVAWLGDMNVAPEAIDIHNAEKQANHVCFHEDVRRAFADTCGWGFEDVFRKHHPEPGQYTFFDYRTRDAVKRKMGWRVDHILATPCLARRSTDAKIDLAPRKEPSPSDHAPIIATFDL